MHGNDPLGDVSVLHLLLIGPGDGKLCPMNFVGRFVPRAHRSLAPPFNLLWLTDCERRCFRSGAEGVDRNTMLPRVAFAAFAATPQSPPQLATQLHSAGALV